MIRGRRPEAAKKAQIDLGCGSADGPPVPVSIDAVSVETPWADQWSDESGERVGRRQEPALARSMSLPNHGVGPKGASLTDRPLSVNAGLTGVDRDGRFHGSQSARQQVRSGRARTRNTVPYTSAAIRDAYTGARRPAGAARVTQHPTGAVGLSGEVATVTTNACVHGVSDGVRCDACENEWASACGPALYVVIDSWPTGGGI